MSSKTDWKQYNSASAVAPPRPRLLMTLGKFFPQPGSRALDLGCGGGRDARELLARGWVVDAIDNDDSAVQLTSNLTREWPNSLNVIQTSFEALRLETEVYDLVNASYSLPFCRSIHFGAFFNRLKQSIRVGGVISCELFGKNDSWNNPANRERLTFFDRTEIESLMSGFIIETLEEEELDAPSFTEPEKHWHTFILVGRKRAI